MRLVLFFTRDYGLKTWADAGILEREVKLYQRLQQLGVAVTFVTYGNDEDLQYVPLLAGIRILCNRFSLSRKRYERWLPFLHAPYLWRADVFKTNQMEGADIAVRTASIWNKPLIVRTGYSLADFTQQQHGIASQQHQRARQLEQAVYQSASAIIVTTPAMGDSISEYESQYQEKTHIHPNFVDTEVFMPRREKPEWDLIFVGRLNPQKNLTSLLEAIRPLDVNLCVIGDGINADELKQTYGTLDGRVTWMGRIPHHDIPDYFARSRIYILPSHYEGHPKTLIEAMACGMPVIGARSPGIQEMIVDGVTGLLSEGTPESLAKKILQLKNNADLQDKLGRSARDFAVKTFSLQRIVQQEYDVISNVVKHFTVNRPSY